jgi:hypothetical protein
MVLVYEELTAVAPEALRGLPARRKATVDLYVNLVALSAVFGILTTVLGLLYSSPVLMALLLAYVIIGLASYRLAVISCDRWRRAIEALVNLGRKPLAEALGYPFPIDPKEEREFWRLAIWDLKYGPPPEGDAPSQTD